MNAAQAIEHPWFKSAEFKNDFKKILDNGGKEYLDTECKEFTCTPDAIIGC